MTRTHAWLTTGATVDCLGTRLAGGAVTYARRVLNVPAPTSTESRQHLTCISAASRHRYARRVLNVPAPTCVGICDADAVLHSEGLGQVRSPPPPPPFSDLL